MNLGSRLKPRFQGWLRNPNPRKVYDWRGLQCAKFEMQVGGFPTHCQALQRAPGFRIMDRGLQLSCPSCDIAVLW